MRKVSLGLLASLPLLFLAASPARAQVHWDGPLLVSPGTPAGWGVFLVDPGPGPHDGIGVLSTWRSSDAPGSLGYRVGLAEGRGGDLTVYGGMDISGNLVIASADFPLDVIWVGGVGAGVGKDVILSFPLGASLGRDFQADGVWFNPYFTPRVVLDAEFGSSRRRDGLELGFAVDLGIDVAFDPGWAFRFAGSLGDRRGLAVGINFRLR